MFPYDDLFFVDVLASFYLPGLWRVDRPGAIIGALWAVVDTAFDSPAYAITSVYNFQL